jgi:hypothetical protein
LTCPSNCSSARCPRSIHGLGCKQSQKTRLTIRSPQLGLYSESHEDYCCDARNIFARKRAHFIRGRSTMLVERLQSLPILLRRLASWLRLRLLPSQLLASRLLVSLTPTLARQKAAKVLAATISRGTMAQFEIDADRRSWIRRSACCRSRSALS